MSDLETNSITDYIQWMNHATQEEVLNKADQLSPEEMVEFTRAACNCKHTDLPIALVKNIKDSAKLERMGMAFTLKKTLHLLDYQQEVSSHLPPFFVGMDREAFVHLLMEAQKKHLMALKRESGTEPIQHHLTLLAHALTINVGMIDQTTDEYEQQISSLDVAQLTYASLFEYYGEIENISGILTQMEKLTSSALAIAWNSNRTDLIDKLSKVKEQCERYKLLVIGFPANEDRVNSGLYAKLEEKLNSIFGPDQEDAEPAMEAMVKFSVWYLKDYQEIGLLPGISVKDDLDADTRNKLFALVQTNLNKLGLRTLNDLKERGIYSKYCLKEYIEENSSLLEKA